MKRALNLFILIIVTFFLLDIQVLAQARLPERNGRSTMPERGIVIIGGMGIAGVRSDICGLPECNNFGLAVNIGGMYKRSAYLGYGVNLGYARLGATEKDPNRPLNLSFQSEVIDVTATVTLNLMDSYAGAGNYRSVRKRFMVPYVRAGAGIIYYTPTSFPGEGDLDDSQTTYDPERNYPAISPIIPLAGGIRFWLTDEFSLMPELTYNITFSDYLDNFKVDNSGTDHYGTAMLKIMYTPVIKNKLFSRKY